MESRVLIHYNPADGIIWAEYLCQKLRAKPYEINCEKITFGPDSVTKAHSSILNVFFVTPDFLDDQNWSWTNSLDKNTCILVLTGTDQEDLELSTQIHKSEHVLDFLIHQLTETEESVRDLLIIIITKYEYGDLHRSGSLSSPVHAVTESLRHTYSDPGHIKSSTSSRFTEKTKSPVVGSEGLSYSPTDSKTVENENGPEYDVLPKYQRQVNGLRDVIYQDDKLYLLLWRRAEGTLKVKLDDKYISTVSADYAAYELPYKERGSANISVILDGETIGTQLIQVQDSTNTEPASIQSAHLPQSSPQTDVSAQAPRSSVSTQTEDSESHEGQTMISQTENAATARDSLYVNVDDVFRDGPAPCSGQTVVTSRKNKLDLIRNILEQETDPEELLCQCLGIDKSVRQLDEKMTSMVQSVETLRHLSFSGKTSESKGKEESTWPTLVHFGAQFNLLNFCDVLLSNPLMYGACVRKNKDGNMPHDIAKIHGHYELADMLKHFAEFVRAEKERDSGISGFSITPRMSTLTMSAEPPPRPHRPSQFLDNYVDMSQGSAHEGYVNKRDVLDFNQQYLNKPREISKLSKDGGFCGSAESDDDYVPAAPPMTQALFKDSFWGSSRVSLGSSHSSNTIHDSAEIDPERQRSTLIGTDEDSEPEVEHHRKDVANLLGISPQAISPDDEKKPKSSKLRKFFFGNKNRSKSEPYVLGGDVLTAKTNVSPRNYLRDSTHSSKSSSSTASTYSDSSFREEDYTEIQMRGDRKHSGKKKIKGFLKTAKKRQSIRIREVMADHEIRAPALPSKTQVF